MASSGKMSSPTTTSLDSSATSFGMILSSRNGLETRGGYLAIYRKNPTWPVASKCVTITFYTTLQKVWKITTPAGKSGLNYINSPKFAACVLLEVFVYDFLRPVFGIGVEWDTSQWCQRWLEVWKIHFWQIHGILQLWGGLFQISPRFLARIYLRQIN